MSYSKKLLLFDVDGTLAESTLQIKTPLLNKLKELYNSGDYSLSLVGGGTYEKILSQIGKENEELFDYICSENGLVSYSLKRKIHENDIRKTLTETRLQSIINYLLMQIISCEIPYKRGSFIRFRKGMLYVTPIGGDCSKGERAKFSDWDKKTNFRQSLVTKFNEFLKPYEWEARLGGQIGIGVHPIGWDKSYIESIINFEEYSEIHFYGDRCTPDGNDYPLYNHPKINGNWVHSPEDTLDLLNKLK